MHCHMKKKRYATTKHASSQKHMRYSRASVVFVFFFVLLCVIAVRLYVVQIATHEKYIQLAHKQHTMYTSFAHNVRVVSAFFSLVPNGGDGGDVVT